MAPALARTAAGRVVEMLSPGVALAEEPYAAWAEPARQELRELLRRARYALAEAARIGASDFSNADVIASGALDDFAALIGETP